MRFIPGLFSRILSRSLPLSILITVMVLCPAGSADLETVSRQVNGQSVSRFAADINGPEIWTDNSGYRAVVWKDRSWRAHRQSPVGLAAGRTENVWEASGPFAADIHHIVTSHTNPNIVYAAVSCGGEPFLGGVYRSTNGGQDWIRLAEGTELGPVNGLAMNPDNSLEIFAAAESGLFTSTDGGNSWEQVHPVDGTFPRSSMVAYNPSNGNELLAHYKCDPAPVSSLFRSTDGGESFTAFGSGLPQDISVTDISFDPVVETRIFVTVGSDFGDTGFWYTEDSGTHWQSLTEGLDGMPVNAVSVLQNGSNSSVMVATGRNFASQFGGLYRRSHPTGEWSRVAPDQISGEGFLEVQRDPQFPGLILVGSQGMGLMKSTDNGLTWIAANDGLTGLVVNCVTFRQDGLAVHAGCEGMGFFTSQDEGDSWVASSRGINMVKVTDVVVDDLDPNLILVSFTSLNSGGVFITEDGGTSWNAAPNLVDQRAQSVTVEGTGGEVIYAAMEGPVTPETPEGIYKSTDGGQSWTCTGPHGPAYLNNLFYKVVMIEDGTSELLAGGRGYVANLPSRLFRSTDGGDNWVQVYQGDQYSSVMDFAVAPQNSTVCYAAVDHSGGMNGLGGVLKSIDGGASWSEVDNGFSAGSRNCRTVAVDSVDSDTAYTTIYGDGVYKTTDGGNSWLMTGFPVGQAHAVLVDPLSPNMVYACSGGFPVLQSKDRGDYYHLFDTGYPENSVYRFMFDDKIWQPRVYACGTQGLYRLDLASLGLPDTLDLTLVCTPESVILPDTVFLNIGLSNTCHLTRSYGLTIDVNLPGGATYLAFRQGTVVLGPAQQFDIVSPINFPSYGSLVGVSTFILTGSDTTEPSSNGGLPGGFSDDVSCQVTASMP